MSSYKVLYAVSHTLRSLIWEAFTQEQDTFNLIVPNEENIVFTNPTETARHPDSRLSLWLYQITENEFLKNQPLTRVNGETERFPPLGLNLFYLLTPFGRTPEDDFLIMGRSLQALYDNAIVTLLNPGDEVAEDLRVVLSRLSLEELTRIWEALREPYRLSVCYQVRVSRIDSKRVTGHGRVSERSVGFGDRPVVAGERRL